MNKYNSFIASLFITIGVTLWVMLIWGESQKELRVSMLMFWYIAWKFLHDKKKDE